MLKTLQVRYGGETGKLTQTFPSHATYAAIIAIRAAPAPAAAVSIAANFSLLRCIFVAGGLPAVPAMAFARSRSLPSLTFAHSGLTKNITRSKYSQSELFISMTCLLIPLSISPFLSRSRAVYIGSTHRYFAHRRIELFGKITVKVFNIYTLYCGNICSYVKNLVKNVNNRPSIAYFTPN